jgi:hypothetical protein
MQLIQVQQTREKQNKINNMKTKIISKLTLLLAVLLTLGAARAQADILPGVSIGFAPVGLTMNQTDRPIPAPRPRPIPVPRPRIAQASSISQSAVTFAAVAFLTLAPLSLGCACSCVSIHCTPCRETQSGATSCGRCNA